MPLCTEAVGESTRSFVLDITVRHTTAYAAGLADRNRRYFDDAASEGVIAPPPFCVSLEWPAVLAARALANFGVLDAEAARGVHASQDSTFHRPIRPGDRLRTTATLVEARETRAGAMAMLRLDTVCDRSEEPVVTTYSGSIYRGVAVSGEARRIDGPAPPPEVAPEDAEASAVSIDIAPELPHVYTECANIWNPIHTERTVALAAALPDIILHGTATWALASREIVARCADGDPTRLERLHGRFAAMVLPGTAIRVLHGKPGPEGALAFRVDNAEGQPAVAAGFAVLRAP